VEQAQKANAKRRTHMTKQRSLPEPVFYRSHEVEALTGLKLRELRDLIDVGAFPSGTRVSPKRTLFPKADIDAWLNATAHACAESKRQSALRSEFVAPNAPRRTRRAQHAGGAA